MKILSTKTVFTSKKFKVIQTEIERDGKKFTKDIIDEKSVVVILPYTKNDEIYLISEYRDALEKEILSIIGGGIEPGDDILTTAKKELQEEAGLKAGTWKHVATWDTSPVMRKKMSVFFATDIEEGQQHLEDDEKIDVVKLKLTDALEKIENGEIPIALHVATILLFDKLKREGKL